MASRRDGILADLVSHLQAAGGPAGLMVDRFPLRPESGSRIGVYPVHEDASPAGSRGGSVVTKRRLQVGLEIRTEGAGDNASADEQLDPLYVWAVKTLLADPTLGGTVTSIEEHSMDWKATEGKQVHGLLYLFLVVTYQTRTDDPETRV